MVFVVLKLIGLNVAKNWYGCSVGDNQTLNELYSDFCVGKFDKSCSVEVSSAIRVHVGRNRSELTKCAPCCRVGNVVTGLGQYIEFTNDIYEPDVASTSQDTGVLKVDAFKILLGASSKASHLAMKYSNPSNDKLRLYNDIIDWLKQQNVGFYSTNVESLGKIFVNTMRDVLWYIDENHQTLSNRACPVPEELCHFTGYRAPQMKKKRKLDESCLTESVLRSHTSALMLLTENVFMCKEQWSDIKLTVKQLGENLLKYANYLNSQKSKTATHQSRVAISEKQKWDIILPKYDVKPGLCTRYKNLGASITMSEPYTPILVNDYAPGEANRRFEFIKGLVVPAKCVKYTYSGSKEHLVFLWKLVSADSESEILNKNSQIAAELVKDLPKYHTRAMRREFLSLFGTAIHNKAAFLREAYRRLTGDCSVSLTADEKEIDKRVSEILIEEDSDLIWDLRVKNEGRPEQYHEFLTECQKYITQNIELAVDERRHDQVDSGGDVVTHLATAFSVRDLHEQVVKQCPQGVKIPSKEWLRFQFWPRNRHFKTSSRYTGRINIKYMIQSRQFRQSHDDMYYASALFRYEKEFCVKYRDWADLVCMDDKHKCKVGEPGFPVAMVERGKSVLVGIGKKFQVGDHDFTKFSLTPSVHLVVDIPNDTGETFHGGNVFVGIKENCFEPSSPFRHACELSGILKSQNRFKPILCLYTDGGPDHRVNYKSVQASLLTLFLEHNLDMLVSVRTPPGNSWKNPAERIMSILNLGFQGVGLMRQSTNTFEGKLKNLSSMKEIRNLGEKENDLTSEISDSFQSVKLLLSQVIQRLLWKSSHLKSFEAASLQDIENLKGKIQEIDPDLDTSRMEAIKGNKQFSEFLSSHCCCRHYMFCIKKCGKSSCKVCKPPVLPDIIFDSLHFIPDPEPKNSDKYKSFDDLYGTKTSEKYRPTLINKSAVLEIPFSPTAQTAKNVEMCVFCSECEKPRVLHSKRVVRGSKRSELTEILSDISYSCGSVFTDIEIEEDHILKSVYVKANLTCEMPLEIPYFSAGFDPACFYCGSEESIQEASGKYPICNGCRMSGKQFVDKRSRATKPKVTT